MHDIKSTKEKLIFTERHNKDGKRKFTNWEKISVTCMIQKASHLLNQQD